MRGTARHVQIHGNQTAHPVFNLRTAIKGPAADSTGSDRYHDLRFRHRFIGFLLNNTGTSFCASVELLLTRIKVNRETPSVGLLVALRLSESAKNAL